jgi:hypothetical protein
VVLAVGRLDSAEIAAALDAGAAAAQRMREAGLIHAAALSLGGAWRVVGDAPGPGQPSMFLNNSD